MSLNGSLEPEFPNDVGLSELTAFNNGDVRFIGKFDVEGCTVLLDVGTVKELDELLFKKSKPE